MARELTVAPSGWDLGMFAHEHGRHLIRLAYVLTGEGQEAQDVVQAVLLRMHSRELNDVQDLFAFARRAVTNEYLTRRRHRLRWHGLLSRLDPAPDTEDAAEVTADRDALLRALRQITARQRAAITLRYFEGHSDLEIAEIIGCSPATVRSLISRALPKLRELLPQEGTR